MIKLIISIVLGFLFGSVLIASEAFSWYRIQEMFHFQSFHMFGLLLSAIATAAVGIFVIRKTQIRTIFGNQPIVKRKPLEWKRNLLGGLIFGAGWGLTGLCSAPVFILIGLKWEIGLLTLLGALIGTYVFARIIHKLP